MTSDATPQVHLPREIESQVLRFGVFEMDLRAGELRRGGQLVRIQPQPFKVLSLLARRPGEVVTREEIQAEVWSAGTFVDFEQSLNFCIRQIRSALGDNALSPRYVETLPRRGYRWVGGSVERLDPATPRPWPRAVVLLHQSQERGDDEVSEDAGEDGLDPRGPDAPGKLAAADPDSRAESQAPSAGPAHESLVSRRSIVPLASLLGAVAALAVAVAAWLYLRPAPPAEPPSFHRLTFRRGLVTSARFAPQGDLVYGAAWDGQAPRIYVTRSDARDTRSLDVPGVVVGTSSSGEVAYLRDGVLARAPVAGGPPKEVLKDVVAADWTADGSEFAVVRAVQGRYRLEFPVGQVIADVVRPSRVRLSPDGSRLALAVHPIFEDDGGSVLVYDRSGRLLASSDGWASLEGLAWPPRGREVWFTATRAGADNTLNALALDGRVRLVLAGMGRLVLHDIAPDGRVLLESATLRSEMLFRRQGEAEDRDLSWLDFSAAVSLSPDGGRVFFFESGQGGGSAYMSFLRGTDGSLPVRVAEGRACALSPDGQWALVVNLRQPDHVGLVPTGPGEPRQIRVPGGEEHEMAGFLPGGRTLFVTTRDASGNRHTWLVNADGSGPRPLKLPQGRALFGDTFSPDGTKVLLSCSEPKGPCLLPLDGSAPQAVPGARPEWRAAAWDDRGRLYFRDRTKRIPETLWRLDPASGRAEAIAELAPRDRAGAQGITAVVVAKGGEAWVYSVMRRLSDLHVVRDVR
jgi:eukaryotic-like serine/threonine-protein kinase